jgi:hypothetical protein
LLSWNLKKQAGEVKLKITDAAGRDVREISGQVLANYNKPGIQSACWDLRVQPGTPPASGGGQGGRAAGAPEGQSGRGGAAASSATRNPFGAGCGTGGGGFGGGFGGFGGGTAGPYVLAGTYNVSLIVDGKTVDTKPIRVMDDPEVALTAVERKRLFDMAMEMHELQRRTGELTASFGSLNRQMTELEKSIGGKTDIPADVKASFDALNKEIKALAPKVTMPTGGRGFGGGGGAGAAAGENVVLRVSQAKNGLMGGMWPTEQTMRAYNDAKTQVPKVIADANVLFAKAVTISGALAKYNLTLTVPTAIK